MVSILVFVFVLLIDVLSDTSGSAIVGGCWLHDNVAVMICSIRIMDMLIMCNISIKGACLGDFDCRQVFVSTKRVVPRPAHPDN
jgi:hypothetical protein